MTNITKENPASTGMDHGAMWNGYSVSEIQYQTNLTPAMALVLAIVKCRKAEGRVVTCEILDTTRDEYAAEMPMIAPLFGIMDHASFCADMATQNEAKAYFVAYFTRLNPENRLSGAAWVQRMVAQ